ncbi:protein disulfide isomerase [Gymnopus androsaceus JB14]|uniref:Protein disulfide-isomerase n=1 Tax=Gymnopus androsaceus JB14 TaxID=1447944 RepID=A0A6A4IJ48_9AGAR|nr:protein disulfide isomerase [Gymnopus androsaceus JB14]
MKFSILSPALALAFAAYALADDSDVISLTSDTFSSVDTEPLILVEFFAPWCGHCKALAPHYEEAATALKEKNIKLAKVDCVDQADLCQANGIQGYPTLKVYKNGTPTDYAGPRKADGIISYYDVTASNVGEIKNADKFVAIAYVSSTSDAPAAAFSQVAEAHREDFLFGLSTDKDVFASENVSPPTVVVYRSFDEPKVAYPYPIVDAKAEDFEEWMADLAIPVIDEVSSDNYGIYAQSAKPLAYVFIDPSVENKDEIIASVRPVAQEFKSKVNFVWIDAIKFGDHAKALNLQEPKWPSFVIQDVKQQLKYPYDQTKEVTAESVRDWTKKFVTGELEPELKSQPIPESQDESVFTLVGKQFDEVVFDDSKDVFVEFYASWCGHCKRLKPTWDQLGDKYADVKDKLIVAKMEATENDLPPSVPFRVSGFPTIKFKPAGSREFIDYEGDRSYDSLVAFVEENAKNSLVPVALGDDGAQTHFSAGNESAEPVVAEKHDEL